jgi:hypothetical protein
MKDNSALAELKRKVGLLNATSRKRKGRRYSRTEIETLKRALPPHLLSLCRELLPFGLLSAKGTHWKVPALGIRIDLKSGNFYELGYPGRIDDLVALYGISTGLSFPATIAALKRIAASNLVNGISLPGANGSIIAKLEKVKELQAEAGEE